MAGWKAMDPHAVKPPQNSTGPDGVMPSEMDEIPDEAQAPHVGLVIFAG
jgi:hypothetical protein